MKPNDPGNNHGSRPVQLPAATSPSLPSVEYLMQTEAAPPVSIPTLSASEVPSTFRTQPFPFMRLPKDVRLCVYDQIASTPIHCILPDLFDDISYKRLSYTRPDMSILRSSREVYMEARNILQQGAKKQPNTFTVQMEVSSPSSNIWAAIQYATQVLLNLTGVMQLDRSPISDRTFKDQAIRKVNTFFSDVARLEVNNSEVSDPVYRFRVYSLHTCLSLEAGRDMIINILLDESGPYYHRQGIFCSELPYVMRRFSSVCKGTVTLHFLVSPQKLEESRAVFAALLSPDCMAPAKWTADVLQEAHVPLYQ